MNEPPTNFVDEDKAAMERNLGVYQWFVVASSIMPWLAVFYLYFIERVVVSEAITLGAVYYISVVLCEVPSGYLSDRYGRKPVLIGSAVFFCCAYVVYLMATGFSVLVCAQLLLAAAIAFSSGSDTSLLFDSLKSLGRENEYGDWEARTSMIGLLVLAFSCLIGGFAGVLDLRLIYLAALGGALWMIYLAFQFSEPVAERSANIQPFHRQLGNCLQYLHDPVLAWIMVVYVLGYALQHVPYEFYQPYIQLLTTQSTHWLDGIESASLVSGIVMAISMFGGAVGAYISMPVFRAIGLVKTLLLGVSAIVVVIAAMSVILHPLILLLIMCRNLPMSLISAPMRAAMAPRIASEHRATYLSIQSLLGRLAFSGMLAMLAMLSSGDSVMSWDTLSRILTVSFICGIVVIVLLVVSAKTVRDDPA